MTEIEQKQQFARDSYKAIRNILYKEHGINNDNLARYMTLQVLQETEWGKKPSGKNNYFGIKAKNNEPFTSVLTTEYIDGKKTMLKQNFRDYDSLEDGYSSFVRNLVTNYDIKNHAKSLNDYTSHVAKKYATDPEYSNKLSGIYNGRTFRQAMDGYYVELPRKFAKPSYIHVEYPDALRVDRLEPYTPIPRIPKPMHPIKENFWKAWSQMPYKQQGGTIMNKTIKKFKQVRKAQQGDKLIKHLSKQLALDAAYGPQYRDWNEVEETPIKITKEKEVKTAPKAEDRYKNSKVEGTIATNGPFSHIWVTANSSTPFIIPAKIGRVIAGNDTTYYEIPQRSTFVEVKNRAAKRVTPFMNKQNPSYKSFDFLSWNGKFGPMIEKLLPLTNDSLEYETLKRRFNIARNLAKPK